MDILVIGHTLLKARRRLGCRGRFGEWVEAEVHLPPRTVSRFIRVAKAFGMLAREAAERITPTALYILSEPGVPQSFREHVADEAKEGTEIDGRYARQLLASHWDTKPAPLNLATTKDPERVIDPDRVFAAENWMLFMSILESDSPNITFDVLTVGNERTITATRLMDGRKPKRVQAGTAEAALLLLTGTFRTKECSTCKQGKRLDDFSEDRSQTDGRARRCSDCENARSRAAAAAKKAKAAAAKTKPR